MGTDFREFAIATAHAAGEELLKYFRRLKESSIQAKDQPHDLVTEADHAAEKLILSAIRQNYPDHAILAEETGASGDEGKEHLWIVDPLDGTINFVHGFPFFAVSIALYVRGEPTLGVIAAPVLDEVFVAEKGKGCYLGTERLFVSKTGDMASSMLTTGFAYERADTPNANLPNFARVLYEARALRRPGSAALDLAYVAAGRFDGFWEMHLSPWDVAAGALLVREAQGKVTDIAGGETWLYGGNLLATNGKIHGELGSYLVFDPSLEKGVS